MTHSSPSEKRVLLLILDGWGENPNSYGNALMQARTPFFDILRKEHPPALLLNNGSAVGLPEGQMGNSEVGHLNIGAGRMLMQDIERIDTSVSSGDFFTLPLLREAMQKAKQHPSSALHLLGLVSDGGVHSHQNHLYALLEMAKKAGLKRVYIHAFLDGRDVPPRSGASYIQALEDKIKETGCGEIATISGRYYAMDRDNRWERVEKAYRAIAEGDGKPAETKDAVMTVEESYKEDVTDEFFLPGVISRDYKGVQKEDTLIFFNFRADRAREITEAFTNADFSGFKRKRDILPSFYCMTEYKKDFPLPVLFPKEIPENTLGEVISKQGLQQLRIAETEKYAHVTFFFNGGQEKVYEGEERVLIPSPKVATYDLQPEMSAPLVTEKLAEALQSRRFHFIACNLANPDMVGHTGIMEAAVKAVEQIDRSVREIVTTARKQGYTILITADHGNIEEMLTEEGKPVTSHSMNPVPFYYLGERKLTRTEGALRDIAPTVLSELNIPLPGEMTGHSLCS